MTNYDSDDCSDRVAIIGMSGRFPRASSVAEFWEKLKSGEECLSFFSAEQFLQSGVDPSLLEDPSFVRAAGVLENIEGFDASFFGYTSSEAEIIDPEHRLFLECAWEALEHAGVDHTRYEGRIGVYAGAGLLPSYIYQVNSNQDLLKSRFYSVVTGNDKDHLAPRVAYKLGLRGPAITVQTACSTSLVAVHLGCQSLLNGESDIVLSGGASIRLRAGYVYEEGGILSPDGHCRAFDSQAAGTVPGSGIGVVVLKRLGDALRDRETIYAVIRGSAINNDGSAKVGYTAPSIDGQAAVIAEAMAVAGVTADSISYIEAHGTGTSLGDPVEISALSRAFRAHTDKKGFCAVGSVKTNVGHLDSAAGVTGLIKTALSLYHHVIPPSLHFLSPNPQLDLANSPFYVNSELREWKSESDLRRAGVSSFGMGGTNAHVILEEAPAAESSGSSRLVQLLLISAKNEPALEEATSNLERHLSQFAKTSLADVAYTLQVGRKPFKHRRALVANDAEDVLRILQTREAGRLFTAEAIAGYRPLAFAFPGQGAQYPEMGRGLYRSEPIFRQWMDTCAEALQRHCGFDVRDFLRPKDTGSSACEKSVDQTSILQPALFALEYSLTQLWMAWGLRPEVLIGHSLGEYVAACVAGVFSLEDALRLVATRGRLMEQIPPGAMLTVALAESELQQLIGNTVSIAAKNGPARCVASGPDSAISELEVKLTEKRVVHRRLNTSRPFHSWMVEPILGPFREFLRTVRFAAPEIPFVSNLTGTWITPGQATDPEYWIRHLREPVNFSSCLDEVLKEPNRILLEIGPGITLRGLAERHPARKQQVIVSSLGSAENYESEQAYLLTAVARLWLAGAEIHWEAFYCHEKRRRISLPTYPFQRERHWIGTAQPVSKKERVPMNPVQMASSPSDRHARIASRLKEIFAGLVGTRSSDIPDQCTFLEMGSDSLMLLQASQEIKRKMGVKVPFRKMLEEISTIDRLAEYIGDKVPSEQFESSAEAHPPHQAATQAAAAAGDEARIQKIPEAAHPVDPVSLAAHMWTPQKRGAEVENLSPALREAPTGSHLQNIFAQQLQVMSKLVADQLALLKNPGFAAEQYSVLSDGQSDLVGDHSRRGKQREHRGSTASSPQSPSHPTAFPVRLPQIEASGNGKNGSNGAHKPESVPPGEDLGMGPEKHLRDLISRFCNRTAGSKRIAEQYRSVLADDRATAGFHPLWKEMQYPLIAERASGSRVWDIDDNEYVDVTMGFGALLFGHSPSFVLEALQMREQNGIRLGWESQMSRKAAELICELTGVERVAFCNSGTEAVMTALRLARTATGRDKIAVFEGAYHGTFDQVLVRRNPDGSSQAMPIAPGIPRHITDSVILLNPNSPEAMDILRKKGHELAAVLVEPLQRGRPDRDPKAFLQELRQIADDSRAALIFDEVITGFRLHPGGAQALFNVRADLVTYGKAMSGGLPVAAVAGKRAYMDAIDGGMWRFGDQSLPEADVTYFAGTFFKHPLFMPCIAAVLGHLKNAGPKLQADLGRTTAQLAERLNSYFDSRNLPVKVVHLGSFFRFVFPPELKLTELFYFHLLEKGVYVCETRNCFLSTAHTNADLDHVVRAAAEAAEEMQEAGIFPRVASAAKGQNHCAAANTAQLLRRQNGLATDLDPACGGVALDRDAGSKTIRSLALCEGQKQVWILASMGSDAAGACNESFMVDLRGPLRLPALRAAFEKVVERHQALRTTITADGSEQRVHPRMEFTIQQDDFRQLDETKKKESLKNWLADQAKKPFDFESGPVFRLGVVLLGNDHHVLALTVSHIIVDARSNGILLGELAALYTAECKGMPYSAPEANPLELAAPAGESGEQLQMDEEYWTTQFSGAEVILDLPTDHPRSSQPTFNVSRESLVIDVSLAKELRRLSAAHGSTLFMTLLSALSVLIHALSRSNDFPIGVNLASELAEDGEGSVGYGINPLALRFRMAADCPFSEHLAQTKRRVLDAYEHGSYPAGRLIKKLNLWQSCGNRLPFSSVVFNLDKPFAGFGFFALEAVVTSNPTGAKVDTEWNIIDHNDELQLDCDFNSGLFEASTIRRWLCNYRVLLDKIISDSNQAISALAASVRAAEDSTRTPRQKLDLYSQSNLTAMQLLFWIGQKLQPDVPVYNRPGRFIIHGPLDRHRFEKAFQSVLKSSDALRTVINEPDGVPQSSVLTDMGYKLNHVDLSQAFDPERTLDEWIAEQSLVNFNFETRLFESALLKLNQHKYVFFINYHNIIADGISGFLIYEAVAEAYERSLKGQDKPLDLPSFEKYQEYERQRRNSPRYLQSDLYWKQKLNQPSSPLTFYGRKPSGKRSRAVRVTHYLDAGTTKSLRSLAREKGIFVATEDLTLFSIFVTALMTYLYQASGNRELSTSVTYHNRISKSFAKTIGVLMQVLPLRITLADKETFRSLSRRISGEMLEGFKHLPYSITDTAEYRKDQVLLNYISSTWPRLDGFPVEFQWDHSGHQDELLVVQLHRVDLQDNLAIEFDFDAEVFDQKMRDQAIGDFSRVISAFIADCDQAVDSPDLLWSDAQKQRQSSLENQVVFDLDF